MRDLHAWLHFHPRKGTEVGKNCHLYWHDKNYFGLALKDRMDMFNERKKDYQFPKNHAINKNKKHIEKLNDKKQLIETVGAEVVEVAEKENEGKDKDDGSKSDSKSDSNSEDDSSDTDDGDSESDDEE